VLPTKCFPFYNLRILLYILRQLQRGTVIYTLT